MLQLLVWAQVLGMVAAHCRQQLPSYPLEHVEASASTSSCHAAIERYNADRWELILHMQLCHLSLCYHCILLHELHDDQSAHRLLLVRDCEGIPGQIAMHQKDELLQLSPCCI